MSKPTLIVLLILLTLLSCEKEERESYVYVANMSNYEIDTLKLYFLSMKNPHTFIDIPPHDFSDGQKMNVFNSHSIDISINDSTFDSFQANYDTVNIDVNNPDRLRPGNYFLAVFISMIHRDSISFSLGYEIFKVD